jgi:D-tyrosyl-tRNA(Tyr) deacylase
MKAVVQRVIDAAVTVNGALKGGIASGLLVYLGVAREDTPRDADWLAEKIPNLRIFDDSEGKMNLSLLDIVNQQKEIVNEVGVNHKNSEVNVIRPLTEARRARRPRGFLKILNSLCVLRASVRVSSSIPPFGVLAVSQFTLLGDARKGRRPTWDKAAPPEKARDLYRYFIEKIREKVPCEDGEFQAHMMVSYTNDGPVTILLDSTG